VGEDVSPGRSVGDASDEANAVMPPSAAGGEVAPVFRGTGVSVALVIGVVVTVLAIIIAIQNTDDVDVDFLAWDVEAPLVAVILAAAVAGVLFDEILGLFWRRRRRHHLAERAELRRLRGR
jgi:uncharacterized integral membrane protein